MNAPPSPATHRKTEAMPAFQLCLYVAGQTARSLAAFGDLSNEERVLVGLDLQPAGS